MVGRIFSGDKIHCRRRLDLFISSGPQGVIVATRREERKTEPFSSSRRDEEEEQRKKKVGKTVSHENESMFRGVQEGTSGPFKLLPRCGPLHAPACFTLVVVAV